MQRFTIRSIVLRKPTTWVAFALAILLALSPMAAAMGFGITNSNYSEAKSSGWNPAYGQFWIGKWSDGNWQYLEQQLNLAKQNGVTPVIQWYYWGDAISPNCIQYGCNGLSQGQWWSMGDTISKKVNAIMGDRPVIFVVETEFNKFGVQDYEAFDGMLADHIKMMDRNAPNAKFALGFGAWGHDKYGNFDRAMAVSDYAGTQLMRGITKDSWNSYWNAADETVASARALKNTFGKPVIVHDIALSSYQAGSAQKHVIDQLNAKKGTLESYGVFALVYRDLRDYKNACSCWYYGEAEKHFGLKTSTGSAKSAWWSWVNMAKGGSASLPDSGASTGTSTGDVTFNPKAGNAWWIQVSTSGASVSTVEARIGGGSWFALDDKGWGWTKGAHVGDKTVQFRAKTTGGSYVESETYRWSDGAVVASASTGGSESAPTGDVTFNPKTGNSWWIQVSTSGATVSGVDARIDGGSWFALDDKGWGWTKGTHVPADATVQFRAKTAGGDVLSATYRWVDSVATSETFSASFTPKTGTTWWVQVDVNADKPLQRVDARIDGGSWFALADKGWGWAKSEYVPAGGKVQFRAVATDGSTAYSGEYPWR